MPSLRASSGKPAGPAQVSWRQARQARARLAAGGLEHREQRRLLAICHAREEAARRGTLRLQHIGIAVAGAIAAMAVIAAAFGLWPAIEAARGQGTSGSFIVGYESCSRGCTWVGSFRPGSGPVIPAVTYNGFLPVSTPAGTSIPASYLGGSRAFARHGSHVWIEDALLMVLVGAAAGAALWISPIRVFRPR